MTDLQFIKTISLGAVVFSSFAFAQEVAEKENEFSISAQIRPRFEVRNGAYKPLEKGQDPAVLVNNRTRITMDYSRKDNLKLRISAQNVNIWGQANQVQVNDPSGGLAIYEAYADLKISEEWSTKVGRQSIALDDERIFGALDWHPAGRSHDALNVNWKTSKAEVKTYVAYNQNYKNANLNINNPVGQYFNPTDAQPYQHMEMIHSKFKVSDQSNLSLMFANLGFKSDQILGGSIVEGETYNMQTTGFHFNTKYAKGDATLSGYYQFGENNVGKEKSAYMLSGVAKYAVSAPFSISLGADYLSGDDVNNGPSSKSNYFDPLYGTHHKFYGYMDYFYVAGANNPGLLDIYLAGNYKINKKVDLYGAIHQFNASGKIFNQAGNKVSSNLGTELDLQLNYQIMPFVTMQTGYSMYFDSEAIKVVKNTPNPKNMQNWFWLSLNINPKIFNYKF